MPFLGNGKIPLSLEEFVILVDRRMCGAVPGTGYGQYWAHCDFCFYQWKTWEKQNTKGKTCPRCGYYDPGHLWLGPASEIGDDGSWLFPVGWNYAFMNSN